MASATSDPFAEPEVLDKLPLRRRLRTTAYLIRLGVALVWESSRSLTIGVFALMLLEAALAPVQLALTGITIDSITARLVDDHAGSDWGQRFTPTVWLSLTATVLLVSLLIKPFSVYMLTTLGDRTTIHTSGRLLDATNRWYGLERFESPAMLDDLKNATSRGGNAGSDLLTQAGPLVVWLLTAATLCLALASLHPIAPVLIVAAAIPRLVVLGRFQNVVYSHMAWQAPEARRLQYFRDLPLWSREAKDFRLFEMGDRVLERYDIVWRQVTDDLNELRRTMGRQQVWSSALSQIASGGVVLFVIWRATRGDLSVGQLTLFIGGVGMLNGNLLQIGAAFSYVPRIIAFLPSIRRVLEAPPDLPIPVNPATFSHPLRRGITFEHVSFAYPETDTPVLKDVSFTLDPGESVALVGHNGAGKTTLIKLLLRLYDPNEGRISLDGVDIRDYHPDDLRRACGVIFQDFGRYDFTARENIAIGDIATMHDDERHRAAIAKAGAESVIETLPDGLETMLGFRFGGREISGGEWQKIALARAFVRDAPILILDEPTAALDVRAEYDVYQRFADLTRDRATMLISHRFSTVRMADRILVLDGSTIAEQGTHDELMDRNGTYARLYTAQARHYVDSHAPAQDADQREVVP